MQYRCLASVVVEEGDGGWWGGGGGFESNQAVSVFTVF